MGGTRIFELEAAARGQGGGCRGEGKEIVVIGLSTEEN